MTPPRHLERTPLAITIVLHVVILGAFIWFGRDIEPLPVPKHIQAVIFPTPSSQSTSDSSSSSAKQALPAKEKPQKPQVNKQEEAERKAAELAAAVAVQKAQALAEAKQQKRELEKQQAIKEATAKQAETEQKYALKKAKEAEKLKAELEAKRIKELADKEAKKAEEKAKARLEEKKQAEEAKKRETKEAADNAKAAKERALKDLKAAQEKVDKAAKAKAAKEQAIKDAKAAKANQEDIQKMLRKANADALRRIGQSLGSDDAEIGNLKSQVAANAKANSIGKYAAQIKSHIKSAWRVPAGSSGITATARFTLSSDGSIASVVITQSSGNDDFDASIKALRSLSGVPVPDDSEVFNQVRSTTITFKAP